MLTSDRLARLGSGVFDRNDRRKAAYGRSAACAEQPLIDLSLGSTDLLPPPAAVRASGPPQALGALRCHAAALSASMPGVASHAGEEDLSLIHI